MAEETAKQSGPCFPARYIFTCLVSIGLAIVYGLKVNLSVAIVAMINNTALAEARAAHYEASNHDNVTYTVPPSACPNYDTGASSHGHEDDGPFEWDEFVQGLVLGSYFWGYIVTQIPGGRIAEMYSAKWVMWGCVFIQAALSILTPVAANISYIAVLVIRVVEGLGAGVSLPSIHVMLSKWAPPAERNRISSLAYAGMAVGTVIALPFSGILAQGLGWEWVFYIQGGLSLIWCVAWIFLVYDSPQQHPRIHPAELEMFRTVMPTSGGGAKHGTLPVPWKSIWTSAPFYAILVAHTCNNWGWYMLLVQLPTYMKQILRFNIKDNGLLSAVPYLAMFLFSVIWSNRLDWAKGKGWVTTTTVRKISTLVCSLLPAGCLVGVALAGCNREAAVTLMSLGAMFFAGMYCGFLGNHIDIASNYAGTLMAITNTFATIPGFVVPVFVAGVGQLTAGNQTLQWQIVFFTTGGILLIELIAYSILASGEEQPWNRLYTGGMPSSATNDIQLSPEEEALNKKIDV